MKINNQNNNRNRFVNTDEDMPGIVILKHGGTRNYIEGSLKNISENRSADLQGAFNKAAEMLIQNSILIAGESQYQIKEVEFYFSSEAHKDPYVHSAQYSNVNRQFEFGEWYFHRFVTREKYTHNRRGLDLTIGNRVLNNSGGILIRGLKSLADGRYIQGPSNVVKEILIQLDSFQSDYSIDVLAIATETFVFNAKSPLRIASFIHQASKLLNSKRYGLAAKIEDLNDNYLNAPYRYFDEDYFMKMTGRESIFRGLVERGIYGLHEAKEKIGYNIK
jgi:hypothetical protein